MVAAKHVEASNSRNVSFQRVLFFKKLSTFGELFCFYGKRFFSERFFVDINHYQSLALNGLNEVATCSIGLWLKVMWLCITSGFGYPMGQPINFTPKSGEAPPLNG